MARLPWMVPRVDEGRRAAALGGEGTEAVFYANSPVGMR